MDPGFAGMTSNSDAGTSRTSSTNHSFAAPP
jgi:hypothetical protein